MRLLCIRIKAQPYADCRSPLKARTPLLHLCTGRRPVCTFALSRSVSLQRILLPVHEKAVRFEAEGTTEGGDEGDITAGGGDAAAPGRFFRAVMRRVPPFPAVGQCGDIFFGLSLIHI